MTFGTIIKHDSNLAEIVVGEGVEMDLVQVKEYHNCLLSNLKAPFYVLVNRKYSYTYTFEAQKEIMSFDKIKKLAVLLVTHSALMSTETLLNLNENINWEIASFRLKDDALAWLKEH